VSRNAKICGNNVLKRSQNEHDQQQQQRSCVLFGTGKAKNHPEFTIIEDTVEETSEIQPEEWIPASTPVENAVRNTFNNEPKFEYAALLPGTVVQIQIGDTSLARKAWKKRRRSDSPLLVPCSVINVDRQSMVRWNILYLLEKFGTAQKDGIAISLHEIVNRHKRHLKSSLKKHAEDLGFADIREMVEILFNKNIQNTYGVRIWIKNKGDNEEQLWVKAPISRFRAQKKAQQAALLQLYPASEDNNNEDDEFKQDEQVADTMKHSGHVRLRVKEDDPEYRNKVRFEFPPLSAALRINNHDDISETVGTMQTGSIHSAIVFDYDTIGDGGSPLLTLSFDDPSASIGRNSVKNRLKLPRNKELSRKYKKIYDPVCTINQLKIGDNVKYDAKVVHIDWKGKKVLVDCHIGRQLNNNASTGSTDADNSSVGVPDLVKVLGTLPFEDILPKVRHDNTNSNKKEPLESESSDGDTEDEDFPEEMLANMLEKLESEEVVADDEEIEDISHMFQLNDDGNLLYDNPETQEKELMPVKDEDNSDAKEVNIKQQTHEENRMQKLMLPFQIGDCFEVYIKSVLKQSHRYIVTMDGNSVRGKNAKDLKQRTTTNKKLKRLEESLVGGLDRIRELEGTEMIGTVKASSRTGDWLYVKPNDEELPVGVAKINDELKNEDNKNLSQGDLVRIKIDGIDKTRGQLALTVIEKVVN